MHPNSDLSNDKSKETPQADSLKIVPRGILSDFDLSVGLGHGSLDTKSGQEMAGQESGRAEIRHNNCLAIR